MCFEDLSFEQPIFVTYNNNNNNNNNNLFFCRGHRQYMLRLELANQLIHTAQQNMRLRFKDQKMKKKQAIGKQRAALVAKTSDGTTKI
jgi:hypothetical protein